MTKGWCPVHDRIVETRDETCPECGTPLVDLTARPGDDATSRLVVEEEPEPDATAAAQPPATETALWPEIRLPQRLFGRDSISIGVPVIAAILIAAVAGSFLVGLAIPRGKRGAAAIAEPSPPVRREVTVGRMRAGPGVDLRLESLSQRGSRVTLRVTVPDASKIDVGRVQSVEVTPILASGGDNGSVVLFARTTVSPTSIPGFVAEGDLGIAASAPVLGIRVNALNLSAKQGVQFPLDLSSISPLTAGGPRVKVVRSATRSAGFRDYQVADIVAWPDRLEVRMYLSGELESWFYDEVFTLEQPATEPVEGSMSEAISGTGFAHLVFRMEPPWSRRSVLRVTVRGVSINGAWAWDFR